MLKFFRKIRKSLIDSGNSRRYLLYAVGEIALVVIGILIALQINNWNEQRKEHHFEKDLFRELSASLTRDIDDLEFNYQFHQGALKSQDIIINWLESDQPYHDSLCIHFSKTLANTFFINSSGTYETLKSLGLNRITDLGMRDQISTLYETLYDTYLYMESDYQERIRNSINIINGKFFDVSEIYVVKGAGQFYPDPGCMRPIDVQDIKSDNEYKHFVKSLRSANDFFMKYNILNTRNFASQLVDSLAVYLND